MFVLMISMPAIIGQVLVLGATSFHLDKVWQTGILMLFLMIPYYIYIFLTSFNAPPPISTKKFRRILCLFMGWVTFDILAIQLLYIFFSITPEPGRPSPMAGHILMYTGFLGFIPILIRYRYLQDVEREFREEHQCDESVLIYPSYMSGSEDGSEGQLSLSGDGELSIHDTE